MKPLLDIQKQFLIPNFAWPTNLASLDCWYGMNVYLPCTPRTQLSLKPDDKFWPDQISKVTIVTNGNKPRLKEYSRCNN